jgi:primase-polymerase (primpol)-like protein
MKMFLNPRFNQVPNEIREAFKWAVWRAQPRPNQPGKFSKAPRNPSTGQLLSVNVPESFTDFETCRLAVEEHGFSGLGILLQGNGWVGVDIDNFTEMAQEQRGPVWEWIKGALAEGAYVEKSPSGSGLRAIFRGAFPGQGRRSGSLEIYQTKRFLTITGHPIQSAVGGETNE